MFPTVLIVGNTYYFTVPLNAINGLLIDNSIACSLVANVFTNGDPVADEVTIDKRANENIFDCFYNPSNESVGDTFTIELSATIDGEGPYPLSFGFVVVAAPESVSQDIQAIKAKTDQLEFTIANQVDANALSGGSASGDATAANQQAILNKLSKPTVVYSQPDSCSKITIRKGDAYDGVSWPMISQDAGKDVDGKATRLVIFKTSDPDTLIVDATDTGDGQLVQVPLTSAETDLLERSVENDDYSYRLSVTHQAGSVQSWQGIAKII